MVILELGWSHFRNLEDHFINLSPHINWFIGNNGQGKTNLAEAVFLAAHLESFRAHHLTELIQSGQDTALLRASAQKHNTTHKIQVELTRKGRRVWLNQQPVHKLSGYVTTFHALVFNAEYLHQYRTQPAERRAGHDRFLSFEDALYLRNLRELRAVLAQKNKSLKTRDLSSLPEWNHLFAAKSSAIVAKRQDFTQRLNLKLPALFQRLTGRQEQLQLHYRPSFKGDPEGWPQLLVQALDRELALGYALLGPQRDDYRLSLGQGLGDERFSQGEYRAALLAVKLAQNALLLEDTGFSPLLILDDVLAELDGGVQGRILQVLDGLPNQVFVTATTLPEGMGSRELRLWRVAGGQVRLG